MVYLDPPPLDYADYYKKAINPSTWIKHFTGFEMFTPKRLGDQPYLVTPLPKFTPLPARTTELMDKFNIYPDFSFKTPLTTDKSILARLKSPSYVQFIATMKDQGSQIDNILAEVKPDDPIIVKTLLEWYKEFNYCINYQSLTLNPDQVKLTLALGEMCHNKNLVVGDETTIEYLSLLSYITKSPEIYNITKAYIHIAVFNSKLTNNPNIPMSNDLFNSCFSEANDILDKAYKFFDSNVLLSSKSAMAT
jgi:hypothetical protein